MKEWQSQDKFSESIRKKVDEFGQNPSEGLWGELEGRLDALQPAEKRKRRAAWIFLLPVLLLIGGTLLFLPDSKKELAAGENIRKEPASSEINGASARKEMPDRTGSDAELSTAMVQKTEGTQKNTTETKSQPAGPSQPALAHANLAETGNYTESKQSLSKQNTVQKLHKKRRALQPVVLASGAQGTELKESVKTEEVSLATLVRSEYSDSSQQRKAPEPVLNIAAKGFGKPAKAWIEKMPRVQEKELKHDIKNATVSALSIAIVNNVSVSGMQIAKPEAYAENSKYYGMETLIRKMQSGRVNYSGGFSVGFRFSDRLMLSVGLRMSTLSEKYSYDTINVTKDPSNAARYNDKFSTARIGNFYKNAFDSIIPGNRFTFINRYTWREVPLTLTYYLPLKGKWNGFVEGGFSFMQASYVNAAYVDEDRVGFIILEEKESYPVIQNTTAATLSLGVSYRHNSRFSFEIAPSGRYALRSITENKLWVQQRPYFMGLNFTVRRHF